MESPQGDGEEMRVQIQPGPPVSNNTYFFEEVEIEVGTDNLDAYEAVSEDLSDESDESDSGIHRTVQSLKEECRSDVARPERSIRNPAPGSTATTEKVPVVDDFLRNFLVQNGMTQTLGVFQAEWYERQRQGKNPGYNAAQVPDVYVSNQLMAEKIAILKKDLKKMEKVADNAKSTWDKLKKERDFHRMHHRRVVQEKNKLAVDMKRLKKNYASFEPTLKALKLKYEGAMKEKMMMRLERDKLEAQIEAFEAQFKAMEASTDAKTSRKEAESMKKKSRSANGAKPDSELPEKGRYNPYYDAKIEVMKAQDFTMQKTFKGHSMSISGISCHPNKPIIATVSDDRSWKLWSIPNGELIFCGEGHRDWVAGCDFHPGGGLLATASADGTVKIWDFESVRCRSTLPDHSQVVWDVAFHDCGDFAVSCSIDHSAKLWDIQTERCRQTFRGHVDSVNSLGFQPFSNAIVTGSGDKTVSMWDLRSGLCTQTFFGHNNAVSHVAFSLQGDTIVSSDADGVLKLWDIRTVSERLEVLPAAGLRHPVNETFFDPSGQLLLSAVDDGTIKVRNALDGSLLGEHAAHDSGVQCLAVDRLGRFVVSGGSDCTFRLWS